MINKKISDLKKYVTHFKHEESRLLRESSNPYYTEKEILDLQSQIEDVTSLVETYQSKLNLNRQAQEQYIEKLQDLDKPSPDRFGHNKGYI